RFSWRYAAVELGTGLAFAALFYLAVYANLRELPLLEQVRRHPDGLVPLRVLPLFIHHATLLGFLIVASLCDLDDMEIPLPLTVTGTLVGLVFATLVPWPYPEAAPGPGPDPVLAPGVYAWPVWWPLPAWLPPGSWQLGLATGLAGALAGMVVLRGVRFLFGLGRGKEGMGVGDADLMMMAGAFIGWQPVVAAFLVSVFPGLLFALAALVRRGEEHLPFGPPLALGVLVTLFAWPRIGAHFRILFFDPLFLGVIAGSGALMLVAVSFILRMVRGAS